MVVDLLVNGRTIGHLATSTDGIPHTTPVWLDYDQRSDLILVDVAADTKKLRDVRSNPNVALSFVDPIDNGRWVILRGMVVDVQKDDQATHIQTLALRYLGRHKRRPGFRRILRVKTTYVRWWGESV
ncbi:pyridoxamine 5'-phosphate oxidase family protein [Parafrankia sp. FMc6]|uniref:pyridoxamine 5'-phosphate oxidase family protein n=1 Tax=Parafrankia soli TaxID=2599596 RepID=UPI0034D59DAD